VCGVAETQPVNLARELGLDRSKALEVLSELRQALPATSSQVSAMLSSGETEEESAPKRVKTADAARASAPVLSSLQSLLEVAHKKPSIVTFCQGIDALLGEGMPTGEVTEVVGAPGVGKTQLCMQLAVDATIPESLGGVDGQVVYVDTEGSFVANRCAQVADALATHLRAMAETRDADIPVLSAEEQLSRIHVIRCLSLAEQLGALLALPSIVESIAGPPVRLIIVDSIAFHYRAESADPALRAKQLAAQAQVLHGLAMRRDLAVVVINHVTTKVSSAAHEARAMNALFADEESPMRRAVASAALAVSSSDRKSHLVPALGDSWAHACTNRLHLFWSSDGIRIARLSKSPSRSQGATAFTITEEGIRAYKDVALPATE
jgi:RAD51-like protein 2